MKGTSQHRWGIHAFKFNLPVCRLFSLVILPPLNGRYFWTKQPLLKPINSQVLFQFQLPKPHMDESEDDCVLVWKGVKHFFSWLNSPAEISELLKQILTMLCSCYSSAWQGKSVHFSLVLSNLESSFVSALFQNKTIPLNIAVLKSKMHFRNTKLSR